jgi:hypothetical protein
MRNFRGREGVWCSLFGDPCIDSRLDCLFLFLLFSLLNGNVQRGTAKLERIAGER